MGNCTGECGKTIDFYVDVLGFRIRSRRNEKYRP
ncbi:MAG: hypothetical protein HS132_18150 [Planctomycetia bacterium]|nr:hypothetical protein [Planctomycetia bacterium]